MALRVTMGVAAFFHAVFVIYASVETRDWKIPRSIHFNSWENPVEDANCGDEGVQCTIEPATHYTGGSISLRGLCVGFHALSAAFVLFQAIFWTKLPLTTVESGVNWFRWLEYALSAPLMVIILQALCGSFDVCLQVALCALTSATMICGLFVELVKRVVGGGEISAKGKAARDLRSLRLIAHALGWACQTALWVCLFVLLNTSLEYSLDSAPGDIKLFVQIINIVIAVLFLSFGVVQLVSLFVRGCVWQEYAYVGLSLASKTLLGALLFAGVIARDGNVQIVTANSV